jgi:hypothetical protein
VDRDVMNPRSFLISVNLYSSAANEFSQVLTPGVFPLGDR